MAQKIHLCEITDRITDRKVLGFGFGCLRQLTDNRRHSSAKMGFGAQHCECVLAKARQLGCDFVGLQETRKPGKTEFSAAGYRL